MALRRQMMNVVKNHTDVEVKVREATSNDPWGPSSSLMSYIADATYNVAAFSEIMGMLWKRLNDHGKNWRHVYKSLVVLDYIIKTGSERVGQQCRENIFAVQTLKDFQYIDKDGKDQGVNIREKSKQLVLLLKDDERLKNERQRALKAKERFAQTQGGIGNTNFNNKNKRLTAPRKEGAGMKTLDDSSIPSSTARSSDQDPDRRSTDGRYLSEMEKARPSNEAEEEMQLQIALAMSREAADEEHTSVEGDEQRLKIGLQRSSSDAQAGPTLLDLTDPTKSFAQAQAPPDPWSSPSPTVQHAPADPWAPTPVAAVSAPVAAAPYPVAAVSVPVAAAPYPVAAAPYPSQSDPWAAQPTAISYAPTTASNGWNNTVTQPPADPWAPASITPAAMPIDPFAPQATPSSNGFDPRAVSQPQQMHHDPFDMNGLGGGLPSNRENDVGFLGQNSKLVDFENLVSGSTAQSAAAVNPFGGMPITEKTTNPFSQDKPKPKSINEIRYEQSGFPVASQSSISGAPLSGDPAVLLPQPLIPLADAHQKNPFL